MELGLLLLRAVVGGLFVVRGAQRRYGSFDGMGRERTVGHFRTLGYRDAGVVATVVTMTELISGSLLVLGLLVPVAAAGIVAVMVHAAVAYDLVERGPWVTNAGYEYPVVLGTVAVALAGMGPGAVSFDALLGFPIDGWVWALASAVLGIVCAVALLGSREGADVTLLDRFRGDEPTRAA